METRYKFVKSNGKTAKNLKPGKDIPVSIVSVRTFEEGNHLKVSVLEITLRIEAEPGKYDKGGI